MTLMTNRSLLLIVIITEYFPSWEGFGPLNVIFIIKCQRQKQAFCSEEVISETNFQHKQYN